MQPHKARKVAASEEAKDQGLVARFVWSNAPITPRKWDEKVRLPEPDLSGWYRLVDDLAKDALTEKMIVRSTQEAGVLLGRLHDRVLVEMDGGAYVRHQPFALRLVAQACRLSVLIELAWRPESRQVGADSMARAIRVVEFHAEPLPGNFVNGIQDSPTRSA
jgi:hypothetical protein